MQLERDRIRVWDPFVRVFHWSLVLSYALAWASAEESAVLHERAGYFVLALIGLRLVWGLVGARHARFSDFLVGPRRTLAYLRSLRSGHPLYYLGHNPVGGWMVVALLVSLVAASVSGVMMGGGENGVWEEIHEGFANLSLLLVIVHVSGVAVASLLHHENLVKAMVTGFKIRRNADV
jgi:cytochrome b